MRVLSLLTAVASAASCGLPADVDSTDKCVVTDNWGVYDADSGAGDIKLSIETKEFHTDIFNVNHGATVSTIAPVTNGRYILSCKQPEGEKTIKMVVTRPKAYTDLGGEWVKLFPKDSWKNETNEYEPFLFNKYGSKIPLLRESSDDGGDAGPTIVDEDTLTVYMEVSDIGDYEIMYGNPSFTTTYTDPDTASTEDRWVAVQFKKTILRVGSPWATCSDDVALEGSETYENIGSILPAFFGHPNLNLEKYEALVEDLKTSTVPVKVVLEIFTDKTKLYTMSEKTYSPKTTHPKGAYDSCYNAGNACPEDHSVCEASFCEMDTWEAIIKSMKAIPGVEVLGAVGAATTSSEYDILGEKVDGFFFTTTGTPEDVANTVYSIGEPLLKTEDITEVDTFVTLSSDNIGIWNPFSWYPHIDATKWAAILDTVAEADMQTSVDTLFDRGYGYVFMTDAADFKSASSYNQALFAAIATKKAGGRRLAERELAATTYSWGCDDTLYTCSPVCLGQTGPVTTIASDALCAGEPLDTCKCKCYYDVEWDCNDGEVVCKASKGVENMIVGDLLCENRGTPKPTVEAMEATRQAGECVPMKTTRGEYPAAECLVRWATTPEPETSAEPTTQPGQSSEEQLALTVQDSFAPVAVFALAVLLH